MVAFERWRKLQAVDQLREEIGGDRCGPQSQRDTSELLVVPNEFHPVPNRRIQYVPVWMPRFAWAAAHGVKDWRVPL